MFGGVVGDNMKRMKRREKQENKNIFKMMFPPKKWMGESERENT